MPTSSGVKRGIAASVIASLLVIYFLDPFIRVVLRVSVQLAAVTGRTFFDRNFAQAAMLEERNFGFILFLYFTTTFAFVALMISLITIKRIFRATPPVDKQEKKQRRTSTRKVFAVIFLLLTIVNTGVTFGVIAGNLLQLSLVTSFNQHMRIIAPYIDDQQEEVLVSEWSQMRTEEDYRLIMQEMVRIAEGSGISFPRNLLYSLNSI